MTSPCTCGEYWTQAASVLKNLWATYPETYDQSFNRNRSKKSYIYLKGDHHASCYIGSAPWAWSGSSDNFLNRCNIMLYGKGQEYYYAIYMHACMHVVLVHIYRHAGFYLAQTLWGENGSNEPPWRPKGGVGGGYIPSCTKCGKLKHSYILGFIKSHLNHTLDPIQVMHRV